MIVLLKKTDMSIQLLQRAGTVRSEVSPHVERAIGLAYMGKQPW